MKKIIKISIIKNEKILNSHYSCIMTNICENEKEAISNQIRRNLIKNNLLFWFFQQSILKKIYK